MVGGRVTQGKKRAGGVTTDYFETFNVTVFEVALPFFGVTVTVTLHVPALTPLSVVPDTLQYFA